MHAGIGLFRWNYQNGEKYLPIVLCKSLFIVTIRLLKTYFTQLYWKENLI